MRATAAVGFTLWMLLIAALAVAQSQQGQLPVDFQAYRNAADAIARGESPYVTPEQASLTWLGMHAVDARLKQASAEGRGPEVFKEVAANPVPGPYLYPPTLALLIEQLSLPALAFTALILACVALFLGLWLKETRANPWWFMVAALPAEVSGSALGGNVELVLLGLSLAACWLMWKGRAPWAAPLCAAVLMVKPFYGALLGVFALLLAVTERPRLRGLLLGAGLTVLCCAAEVLRWGSALRAQAFDFAAHADQWSWFVLPPVDQTPMSAWNRAPYQALVSSGVGLGMARALVATSGVAVLVLALRRVRSTRQLAFAPAFAFSLVLLYWLRPVGWGLNYLELVLLTVAWPRAQRAERLALGAAAALLVANRWAAAALTVRGAGMLLFTLQSASLPWETIIVLPGALWLAWRALPPAPTSTPMDPAPVGSQN